MAQLVELFVQRRFDLIVNLRPTVDLTPFGGIAHTLHDEDAVAVDDGTTPADIVGGISGFRVEFLRLDGLSGHRLARQGRFVELQGNGFDQGTVGRDFVTWVNKHHVAHHHVFPLDLGDVSVAHHRHLLLVFGLV